ncbi:MAG: hypothetical protein LBI56_03020 [Puniceicoccales bacterium]|nr:hypothetical protein [Puniceicoccales bacterium]
MFNSFDRESFGRLAVRLILGVILAAKGVMVFVGGKSIFLTIGKISAVSGVQWLQYGAWVIAVLSIVCGVTFAIGAFFKASTLLLGTIVLLEAVCKHYIGYPFINGISNILMLSVAIYGFLFIGSGSYSVQKQ